MKKMYVTVLLITLFLISGCSSNPLKIDEKKLTVELGDAVSTLAKTYLQKDTDKDVLNKATLTFKENKEYSEDKKTHTLKPLKNDFMPVGKYQATMKYKDDKKDITIEVKDTVAPKFVDFKKEIIIEANAENVDLVSYFKADDLSAVHLSIEKGKLDLTKEGTYDIKVIAEDQYENKTSKKTVIKVVSKEVAKKEGVTETTEGTKPVSKALKEEQKKEAAEKKKAEEEKKAQEEQQAAQQQQQSQQASTNTNTTTPPNNQTSNNNTSTPVPPASNACVFTGYVDIGNSGMVFNSKAEMDEYGMNYIHQWDCPYDGYTSWTVRDNCGEEHDTVWTINWHVR